MFEDVVVTTNTGLVIAALKGASKETANAIAKAVYVHSQGEVPVDHGNLKASGRVEARNDGSAVVYGDNNVPYAAAVHEGFRGIRGQPGKSVKVGRYKRGKSHYLRDPLMRVAELLKAGAGAYRLVFEEVARKTYKSVSSVRDYGPGGGTGSGGDV